MTFTSAPNRRDTLKSLLAISAAGALAACSQGEMQSTENSAASSASLKYASEGQYLTAEETAFVSSLAQTIIPKTQTPGAADVGVHDTIQEMLSKWGDDEARLYWREGLAKLARVLRKSAGQDFVKLSALQGQNVLSKYDAQVIGGGLNDPFYRDMKKTVATAYYMSEAGASEELHYDPVPGEWRGDVPFSEIGKAWAT